MRRGFFTMLIAVLLAWLPGAAPAQMEVKRAAAYYAAEGWYPHDCGHMYYISEDGTMHEDVLNIPANSGRKPGLTLQYATFYNGKIYAVSKQKFGRDENRLVRIDPRNWKIEEMGKAGFSDMDAELRTFHFLGVSETHGFLSTSDAKLYRVNLEDLSVALVAGKGWPALVNREVGSMVLYRGRIVVEVYGPNAWYVTDVFQHELWVLDVETGGVVSKFSTRGLFNPVVTKDGRLLALHVQGTEAEKDYSLVQLDIKAPSAAPMSLLTFADSLRPADFQTQVWSWSQGMLFASTRANRLYWNTNVGKMFSSAAIASLDLDDASLTPSLIYTGDENLYGITRENPHDGSLWVNLNGEYQMNDRLVRLVRGDEGYKVSDEYKLGKVQYAFAACPFFEDLHKVEVREPDRILEVKEGDAIDLYDLVKDEDGFSASVLFGRPSAVSSGWEFELIDRHALKVVKASAAEASVTLKAISNGRYSDVTFTFSMTVVPSGYSLTVTKADGGTVKVLRGGEELANGAAVKKGDELVITAMPASAEYSLKSLTVNGVDFASGKTFTVGEGDVEVEATFVRVYSLTVTKADGGTVKVLRGGEELANGAAVKKGDELVITAMPASAEYSLKSLTVNGVDFASGKTFTVGEGDVEVEATFVRVYSLTVTKADGGTVKVLRGGEELANSGAVKKGDELVITATPASAEYSLKSLTVNGVDFASGKTFTVGEGNVEIVADFEKVGGQKTAVESVLLACVSAASNPFYGRLTLRGARAVESWGVYTLHGQLVARGVGDGGDIVEVETADWAQGVYVVRLRAADGARAIAVVKQ